MKFSIFFAKHTGKYAVEMYETSQPYSVSEYLYKDGTGGTMWYSSIREAIQHIKKFNKVKKIPKDTVKGYPTILLYETV